MELLGGPAPMLLDRLQAVTQLVETGHRDLQLLLAHRCCSVARTSALPATPVLLWWTDIAPLFSPRGGPPSHPLSAFAISRMWLLMAASPFTRAGCRVR